MLQGHGDDIHHANCKIIANFSSNVWHGGCEDVLLNHLRENISAINTYPDVMATSMLAKLATRFDLRSNNFLVTNGAAEAIYQVALAFAGQNSTVVFPSFSEYEDACRMHSHHLHFVPIEEICAETRFTTELVFLCNPNNPTGHIFDGETTETLISRNSQTTVVIDQAYTDFSLVDPSDTGIVARHNNVILLRSLTKTCAIPGLRLGYIIASKENIDRLRNCKIPWSVNALAIEAGNFIVASA